MLSYKKQENLLYAAFWVLLLVVMPLVTIPQIWHGAPPMRHRDWPVRLECHPEDQECTVGLKSVSDAAPGQLARIHKSYIVNLSKVKQAGKTSVTLTDGTTLPLGEAYRNAFTQAYTGQN